MATPAREIARDEVQLSGLPEGWTCSGIFRVQEWPSTSVSYSVVLYITLPDGSTQRIYKEWT
jgi:hypothetical protein